MGAPLNRNLGGGELNGVANCYPCRELEGVVLSLPCRGEGGTVPSTAQWREREPRVTANLR